MPGLERAMEPRPQVREHSGGGPQGKERQMSAGGPEGARGAMRGGHGAAVTVPMETPEGERFVLVPTATPDGQPIEPAEAVEAVRAGELEPLGVFSSMEEAERAKHQMGGGQGAQPRPSQAPQGLDEAAVQAKGKGMPPGL